MQRITCVGWLVATLIPAAAPHAFAQRVTERVSLGAAATQLDGHSWAPAVSADGRFVTFMSFASSLDGCAAVPPGTPGFGLGLSHIYLRDREAGTTECVSRASDETPANQTSGPAVVSSNGRYVVFRSSATNLVTPPTSASRTHLYIRDRVAGTTQLLTVATDGVTEANADSDDPRISDDGQVVAFSSRASNLIAGGTTLNRQQVYARSLPGGVASLISVASDGASEGNGDSESPSISPEGGFVGFASKATNLMATPDGNGPTRDVFLRDRVHGVTEVVSLAANGVQGDGDSFAPALSANARIVVFGSGAPNLAPGANPLTFLFARDRGTQTTTLIRAATPDMPNTQPGSPSISADGRMVAFVGLTSPGTFGGGPSHFLHDRSIQATVFVAGGSSGGPSEPFPGAALSGDGRVMVIASVSSDLVPGDTNGRMDVFAVDVKKYGVDVGVYRASTGTWFMLRAFDGSATTTAWGGPPVFGDVPVFTDYDGDGRADIAVYRHATAQWFIALSSGGARTVTWGNSELDEPVPADYDGDGKADIAVYRKRSFSPLVPPGQWLIQLSSDGGGREISWGVPSLNDVPVPADYDGDGKADVAVYRASTGEWFIALSSGGSQTIPWGAPSLGDVPVPGDYDGDGAADIAVYRASTGEWFVRTSTGTVHVSFGSPATRDIAVPADYDADGTTDLAVYRPGTGEWFIFESSSLSLRTVVWGAEAFGDRPVTLPPAR